MSTDPLESAELRQRRLLQSIVEVARSVFGAAAASVLLVDEADGDLVFEAVAGEGSTTCSAAASRPAPASPAGR